MYEFSVPMPYAIENINKILDINNEIEKSKITSMYFSLPSNSKLFTGFEQYRNTISDKNWDYWKNLISHCLENNVDFIYLLNNPARLPIEQTNFEEKLDKLDKLLNELRKLGINKLRIAEHKLMSYIERHYPDFNIYASTSFEFKSIQEYQNFLFMHKGVKQIVPSHDSIKNFTLLKNLKNMLPDVEIELIVNEGCINGCPNRDGHASEIMDRYTKIRNDITMSNSYYTNYFCSNYERQNPFLSLVKSNKIFPWEIEEYAKIQITNFKLVGRDMFHNRIDNYLNEYLIYFKGIDNYKNIENESVNTFIHHLANDDILNKLTVKEIKHLLPDIKYFKKYGKLCFVNCQINCSYCYKCSNKIQKHYENKCKKHKYVSACTI